MTNNTPKISIITICLNDLVGLKKTVESVLTQDYPSLEYIVIDGGSNDGCKEYLETQSDQFYYWISEHDSGIYNAQNKGILQATGDYCLFLNAGDYFYSNSVISKLIENGENKELIYGDMFVDNGKDFPKLGFMPDKLTLDFMIHHTLWHPVTLIKCELFQKFGLYREDLKIVSDYDFFLKVICIQEVEYKHVSIPICVFNTNGIGSSPKFIQLHDQERKNVQLHYFSPSTIELAHEYHKLSNMRAVQIALFVKTKFFDRIRSLFK